MLDGAAITQAARSYSGSYQLVQNTDWHQFLENFETVLRILAIIIGAFVAYYKWFRGRIYRPRLESSVSGRVQREGGKAFLAATIRVKNVGFSDFEFDHDNSGLRLLGYQLPSDVAKARSAEWETHGAWPVLESHGWIESGEIIEEPYVLALPSSDGQAYRLELKVVSKKKYRAGIFGKMRPIGWTAAGIADTPDENTKAAFKQADKG
jgi:hypothetical protein